MTHDPRCPFKPGHYNHGKDLSFTGFYCQCELIALVRNDALTAAVALISADDCSTIQATECERQVQAARADALATAVQRLEALRVETLQGHWPDRFFRSDHLVGGKRDGLFAKALAAIKGDQP